MMAMMMMMMMMMVATLPLVVVVGMASYSLLNQRVHVPLYRICLLLTVVIIL